MTTQIRALLYFIDFKVQNVQLKLHCLWKRRLTKYALARTILTICFFFVEETFNHVLGNKIDQVSPMFISEHQCKYEMQNKMFLQVLFFNNPNKFFVIPRVC